ncbi:MAG: carboxypeptidase M32 [Pirellulales bacterium]|nr:carboxypeptidase M32 [Pirellulales bacterium]
MNSEETYKQLCSASCEAVMLDRIQSLLEWDEQTYMPPAGGEYRSEQAAYLAGLVHQKRTAPQIGEWIQNLADSDLAEDTHSEPATVIRCLRRDYEKKTRLPQSLVEELARTSVRGQQVWTEARSKNDFASFRPTLEKMVGLKRQEAAALGFDNSPYDPLLDDYEPDESTANVTRVLQKLREALVPLVASIAESSQRPDISILARNYPQDLQKQFGIEVATAIGFDFNAGRLDVAVHPFCTGLGPGDVRITTRYDQHAFNDAFFGILHEAGHGIYDQGLPRQQYGLPTGEDVSLGIHESQSRMWENQVGRSMPFWEHFFPKAQQVFPESLGDATLSEFYRAINDVRPSLIRVEADEGTYNLHILIRFELVLALLEDNLQVVDLPAAWNEKYQHYLGILPSNDTEGVLQDVHWSAGLFGYFPTYALGNLYAAQFFDQADQDLGGLTGLFRQGDFRALREWLRNHIHAQGRRYTPAHLVERTTGKSLSHEPLMAQLTSKYGDIYGF